MKRSNKILLLVVGGLFAFAQFIPKKRNDSGIAINDIGKIYPVPAQVQDIFKNSCYDCHSNRTSYPWYANIQPFRYMLDSHINEGKEELNFNEFGTYSKRRQRSKLRAIGNSMTEGTMPISSYLFMHHNARLSPQDKSLILNWVNSKGDTNN